MNGDKKFIIGISVFSVLLFGVLIFAAANIQNSDDSETPSESQSNPQSTQESSNQLAGESQPILGRDHVPQGAMEEKQDPPTSGDHYGFGVAGAGIHDEPVEDGLMVHSLEHGAVVLHYDPEQLNEDQIQQLEDIFYNDFRGKKIMMPRPGMSKPIIMTSWGQILKLDEIQKDQMVNFMTTNNDKGPEKANYY